MASTGCEQDEAEGILSQIEDIANIKAVEAEMQSQASTSAAKNRLFKRKGVRKSWRLFLCTFFAIAEKYGHIQISNLKTWSTKKAASQLS